MPIKSYLVYPEEGKMKEVTNELTSIKECGVISSINTELLVLTTDTETAFDEELLQEKIDAIKGIKMLSLVSGFNNEIKS